MAFRANQAGLVVSEVETIAVEALERIEEDTGATVVPAARACELMRCRKSVREVAESIGLPVTAFPLLSLLRS